MRAAFFALFAAVGLSAQNGSGAEAAGDPVSFLKAIDEGFVRIYEKVAPAVVVIEAKKRSPEEENDIIKGFDLLDEGKDKRKDATHNWRFPLSSSHSEGTGFILRADGFILTNQHVVADADAVEIRLKDGRKFPAKLVGKDEKSDIAVLKIEASELPAVEFGDSDSVRVGQMVCAIGTPFSQDFSFSAGFVSGKDRSNLLGPTSATPLYEDYIQTDAFINPGNSGGPLFDVDGRVVGMNTLIHGLGRGLAFAIPASLLRDVSDQIIATGRVQHPWLGIRIETLGENETLREHIAGVEKGVVVDTIEAAAPACRSGLQPADVITEVDGVKVASSHDLQKQILRKKVGQTVQLSVWRDGNALKIAVVTGELPGPAIRAANVFPKVSEVPRVEKLGFRLRDASPGAVEVAEVAPHSSAANAELANGDLITDVEMKPVTDSAACTTAIESAMRAKGQIGVILNVDRKGKRTFIVLRPEE